MSDAIFSTYIILTYNHLLYLTSFIYPKQKRAAALSINSTKYGVFQKLPSAISCNHPAYCSNPLFNSNPAFPYYLYPSMPEYLQATNPHIHHKKSALYAF